MWSPGQTIQPASVSLVNEFIFTYVWPQFLLVCLDFFALEDDLWPSQEADFENSGNETLSTVREVQHGGTIKSLQQQIGILQKQLEDVQADWEEVRFSL